MAVVAASAPPAGCRMQYMRTREIPEEAAELTDRAHPRRMALAAIYDEVDELINRVGSAGADERDAIHERFQMMQFVLEDRLDIRYPDCPGCGQPSIARMDDGGVACIECSAQLGEKKAEWKREDRRLWGKRGHGGAGR